MTAPRNATITALRRSLETADAQFIAKARGGAGASLTTARNAPRRALFTGRVMPLGQPLYPQLLKFVESDMITII